MVLNSYFTIAATVLYQGSMLLQRNSCWSHVDGCGHYVTVVHCYGNIVSCVDTPILNHLWLFAFAMNWQFLFPPVPFSHPLPPLISFFLPCFSFTSHSYLLAISPFFIGHTLFSLPMHSHLFLHNIFILLFISRLLPPTLVFPSMIPQDLLPS